MALTPEPNEAFVREVDENLRRDQARDFVQTYGKWLIAAAVIFLAAVGGWLYWQNQRAEESAEQSEQLFQLYRDIGDEKLVTVPKRLEGLEDSHSDAVRATALFTAADVAIGQDDRKLAIAKLREASEDGGLPQAYRDIALIRVTALEFDSLKPDDVISRLEPLAKTGEPWFGSAGELTAMALLKQGKKNEAGRLFAAIAADKKVPETIRSRAVQIAGTLGIDASASLPFQAQ